jgi:hypothetical protein
MTQRTRLTASLERFAGMRLSRFGPFELEKFMGTTSVTLGRLTVGWSRYDRPKAFSIARYMPGFYRFRWLTLRVYVAWHAPRTPEPNSWGTDLWTNPKDPYR